MGVRNLKIIPIWAALSATAFLFGVSPLVAQDAAKRTLKTDLRFSESSLGTSSFDNVRMSVTYSAKGSDGVANHYTLSYSEMNGGNPPLPDFENNAAGFQYARSGPINSRGLSYWIGASYGTLGATADTFELDGESFGVFAALGQAIPLDDVSGVHISGGVRQVWRSDDSAVDPGDLTMGHLGINYVRRVGEASVARLGLLGLVANDALTLSEEDHVVSVSVGFETPLGAKDSPYRVMIEASTDVTGNHEANALGLALKRSF